MSEDNKTEKRNWFKAIFKFLLIMAGLVIVSLIILANVGGSGEGYRTAVEEFLTDFTGYPAQVKTLNDMSFYPDVSFDFQDVEFFEAPGSEIAIAKIDKVVAALGFWDMAFQTGKFKELRIETLRARPGVILEKAVLVERFSIERPTGSEAMPFLSGVGEIDGVATTIEMGVERHGQTQSPSYSFGEERDFALKIGEAEFTGLMRDINGGVSIDDLTLSFQNAAVLRGHVNVKKRTSGEITISEHGSVLVPDFELRAAEKPMQISGNLLSSCFYPADFKPDSRLSRALDYLDDVLFETAENSEGGRLSLSKLGLEFEGESFCNPNQKAEEIALPFDLNKAKEISIKERP